MPSSSLTAFLRFILTFFPFQIESCCELPVVLNVRLPFVLFIRQRVF